MQRLLLSLLICLFVAGCCPKNKKGTFVLLPDPDGKVGKISVVNEQGSQTLDQEGQSVQVSSKTAAPGDIKIMDEERIRSLFGKVLDIQPLLPAKFQLYFEFDSTQLKPESLKEIDKLVQAALDRKSMDISVNGHTDKSGDTAYNYQLSLQRAMLVQKLMVEKGIDIQLILTTSHGEGNPLVPTADNVQEPRNRRVEVIIR